MYAVIKTKSSVLKAKYASDSQFTDVSTRRYDVPATSTQSRAPNCFRLTGGRTRYVTYMRRRKKAGHKVAADVDELGGWKIQGEAIPVHTTDSVIRTMMNAQVCCRISSSFICADAIMRRTT